MVLFALAVIGQAAKGPGKIGIFDVAQIHAAPLNPQVVGHTEADGIVTEKIRFDAGPGVRAFAQLSYPTGAKGLPTTIFVTNLGSGSHRAETHGGFVTFSICAPEGNKDPQAEKTVGGPKNEDLGNFKDDPNQSWIYHHVVALTRGLDYLQSRPEVDMKRSLVMGFSWSGYVVALLHAIDERPSAFITWNGTGFYADADGKSGGAPSKISRKHYEMYGPAYYAAYGSKPIFVGNALTDYFATLDGTIETYDRLKSPKLFCFAPNRYHADTSRHEYLSSKGFVNYQTGAEVPWTIDEGVFEVQDGKLLYKYTADVDEAPTITEALYSYGAPGHWTGRTWHRAKAVRGKKGFYIAEIPVYDPKIPVYVAGQMETRKFHDVANRPQLVVPEKLGVAKPSHTFEPLLMDFEDRDDLYVAMGQATFVEDAPEGGGKVSAKIEPEPDGTIHLMNIEPALWRQPDGTPYKTLEFWIKGDGKAGEPVTLYLGRDSGYYLEEEREKATAQPLVEKGKPFEAAWRKVTVDLTALKDLEKVDALWFELPGHTLQIDGVRLK